MLINGGMPPLSVAGYRYFSASLVLLLVLEYNRRKQQPSASSEKLTAVAWLALIGIGFFMYTAQGVHLTALSMISASDSGLVSMTWMPVAVALLASIIERKPPTRYQWGGLGVILLGIYFYFPNNLSGARLTGVLLNVLSSSMWAVSVIITHVAVGKMKIASLKLTAISMVAGSSILLLVALASRVYIPGVGEILWLAFLVIVNTAFAFVLYNHTMKVLGSFEIATFQDTMIVQIGILSAIFLGESITPIMVFGMLIVVAGVIVVQYFAPEEL